MSTSDVAASDPVTAPPSRAPWLVVALLLLVCVGFALRQTGARLQALTGVLGVMAILGAAVAMSSNRRAIRAKTVAWGLGLQLLFAVLVLRVPATQWLFARIAGYVQTLLNYSFQGSEFVFGTLGAPQGGASHLGVLFAFQVLPTIIFIASLFAVLYYLGVMTVIVRAFARVMTRLMGASGAESLNVAASIFMGQTEAPLTVRPFLADMTESELFTVMVSGMAHVSGSIMGAYVLIGHVSLEHLLTAVVMTAPATIMLAKMIIPETAVPRTGQNVVLDIPKIDTNMIDAASRGAGEGLFLALNVGAMLIAFIALIALVNGLRGHLHTSLESLLGYGFAPVAWLLGVPWHDARVVGSLLGTRMVLNEFVAFLQLGQLQATLAHRSFVIATFALCGFANFASIGIQIGGIGSLAPNRKHDLARLGLRAMLAGTLANFMSAAIAGLLLR